MQQRLILHLGLHKTATTFLQKSVWPSWSEIGYAGRPTPQGYPSSEQAVFSMDHPLILMSNESSGGSLKRSYLKNISWADLRHRKLEELKNLYFGKYDLEVVIGLRKPEPWILSVYKHYLKYGGVESLEGFLGLTPGSPPTLPTCDLLNMPKIRQIEDLLGVRPFCFFSEEMKSHPEDLSSDLASFVGATKGPSFSGNSRLNEGVNEKAAAICLAVNRALVNRGCLGKGYIKRNKTIAFDLARKLSRFASNDGSNKPLSVSENVSDAIHEMTKADHEETVRYIADTRSSHDETRSRLLCAGSKASAEL